jgi:lipid-binding SYLF domain-containing protein
MNSLANHIRSRRQISFSFFAISVLVFCSQLSAQQANRTPQKAVEQSKKAVTVLERAMSNSNERIPKALLDNVAAIAVLSDVKKASLLIEGVAMGRGVVSRRGADGKWGPPAFIKLGAMSIGPQTKSNSFDVIMLFMNDQAAGWLLDRAVVFDRAKAPVAGPVGEIRTADKQVIPVADVFSYIFDDSRLQGKDLKNLFKNFGFSFDNDLNQATYGVKARTLLSADRSGPSRIPPEVTVFPDAVTRLFAGK